MHDIVSNVLFRYIKPYFNQVHESVTHLISTIHYYSIVLKWLIEGFRTIPPQFAEHILPIAFAGFEIKSNAR